MKILFFTPYIDLTGSEFFLLNLIKLLKNKGVEIVVISKYKGKLYNEFQKYATVYTLDYNSKSIFEKIAFKFTSKFISFNKIDEQFIKKINNKFMPNFWYVNTIAFSEIYELAIQLNAKVVTHFHELPSQFTTIQEKKLSNIITNSNYLIGCSSVVVDVLKNLGAKNIILQYEAIDPDRIKLNSDFKKENISNISNSTYIVMMGGQRTHRKGVDLFIEVAEKLASQDILFIWVGKSFGDGLHYFVEQKIKKMKNVLFIDEKQDDYFNYLKISDLFFLSSREDPFPLAMIEAGFLGKPIVSFNSGGAKEFIKDFNGICIKGFDIDDLADAILECKNKLYDVEKIKNHANIYTMNNQLPDFLSKLEHLPF